MQSLRRTPHGVIVLLAVGVTSLLTGCGGGGGGITPTPRPDLTAIVTETRSQTKVPSLAVAYITSDSISTELVGVRKSGGAEPITAKDLFQLGSNAKSMTSTLAGVLVEENKIAWNTTINQVFSGWVGSIRPEFRNVTLEQLLTNRAGVLPVLELDDVLALPAFSGTGKQQRLQFAKYALALPPSSPVSSFNYSNGGYAVAGAMLEAAANDSWEHLIETKVLNRVGARPTYGAPLLAGANQPYGHLEEAGQFVPYDARTGYYVPQSLGPSGSICLKLEDFARYAQAHLKGLRGAGGIVRPETYRKLHTPYGNSSSGYAFGWLEATVRGQRVSFHDGSDGTFYATMLLLPSRNQAAVVLVNSGGEEAQRAIQLACKRIAGIDPYTELAFSNLNVPARKSKVPTKILRQ